MGTTKAPGVAPLFGPTRLAGPNRFRDALIPLSVTPVFFFQKCHDPNLRPKPTRMVDPNRSLVYSDRFHLFYQKHFIYVISF